MEQQREAGSATSNGAHTHLRDDNTSRESGSSIQSDWRELLTLEAPTPATGAKDAIGTSTTTTQQPPLSPMTSPLPTPRLQKVPTKVASVRSPHKPSSFKQPLRIDVNPPADLGAMPIALTSPLGMFATKKVPTSSHRAHPVSIFSSGGSSSNSEHRANPQLYGTPFLEYGMIVALSCDDRNGIVAAEGYASRDVRLEKLNYPIDLNAPASKLGLGGLDERRMFEDGGFRLTSCPYRDCLFEVVPKMTYDATLALEALEVEISERRQTSGRAAGESTSHSASQQQQEHEQRARLRDRNALADLKFKSDAELRLNATMYKKLRGAHVIYGHVRLLATARGDDVPVLWSDSVKSAWSR